MQLSDVENLRHFNLADFPVAYQITAVSLMVMGNSKNLYVLNFAILVIRTCFRVAIEHCSAFQISMVSCVFLA